MTSIILLSDKSSGSSAVQREIVRAGARSLKHTPHMEGETLYWMKAVAVLDLEQPAMRYSMDVPYSRARARTELERLVRDNAPGFALPPEAEALVFGGWNALCNAHSPALFEKSPHHLHSRSALSLMEQAADRLPDVQTRYIGLVRNPVDTLYSMWSRWRYVPEVREREWVRAYANLRWFKDQVGDAMRIVRYEDIVDDPGALNDLVAFAGLPRDEEPRSNLHARSVQKWREDRLFGYQPSESVLSLAGAFGYERETMTNLDRVGWAAYSRASRALRTGRQAVARLRGRSS